MFLNDKCLLIPDYTSAIFIQKLLSGNRLRLNPSSHDFIVVFFLFQALNEISEGEGDPEYREEEMGGGSLLR